MIDPLLRGCKYKRMIYSLLCLTGANCQAAAAAIAHLALEVEVTDDRLFKHE